MEFTKTPDKTALVFSPWELRPGTPVTVNYSYVRSEAVAWDSDAETTISVSGTAYDTSVKGPWPIPEDNIEINDTGIFNEITLQPINKGPIDITIFYKIEVEEAISAVSAINDLSSTYYQDWFYDHNGVPTPRTVVPLALPFNIQTYKPDDFTIEFSQPERGISILAGDVWASDSVGTVKMIDRVDDFSISRNLFRKGKMEVRVPMACTIEPIIRYVTQNGARVGKVVELDVQDWDPNKIDCKGILWHRDKLYILTENGMYRFDRWGDLDSPEEYFPEVTGNDLTYGVNDVFIVTEGQQVKIYQVRHDFLHIDRNSDFLRMREQSPTFKIEE